MFYQADKASIIATNISTHSERCRLISTIKSIQENLLSNIMMSILNNLSIINLLLIFFSTVSNQKHTRADHVADKILNYYSNHCYAIGSSTKP